MDQLMLDCGDDEIAIGDEVVILGSQHGPGGSSGAITAEEIADLLGTINYEVPCMIGHRVPRVYRG
jgi:alanine racemase